ncbi:MAG: zf-TFIIB domain-containing protein, partial [Candidatus Omnitrophota bacterium]
ANIKGVRIMDCPVCREPMIVLELDEVEIDHCLGCQGIWLDGGELEILLGDSKEKEEILNSFKADLKSPEKKINCPICKKKMQKISCGREDLLIIDKCSNNHGIWFDRGELYQIIDAGAIDKQGKVISMLSDMFKFKGNDVEKGG